MSHLSLVAIGLDNVVDLEDHLDDLGGQLQLLLLREEGLVDLLLLHIVGALA